MNRQFNGNFVLSIPLIKSISESMSQKLVSDRPTVTTVANAGNWRTVYQHLLELIPELSLSEDALKYPVIFGSDEAVYLVSAGKRGAEGFKEQVGKLLVNHDRIIVLDAQRVACLRLNPDCIYDLLKLGQSATLYYEKNVDPNMQDFLSRSKLVKHEVEELELQQLDRTITELADIMQANVMADLRETAESEEKEGLNEIPNKILADLSLELANQFVARNVGFQQLQDWTRKRIVSLMLKHTIRSYSVKTGEDPIEFFNVHLRDRFVRYKLPRNALNEAAPNLSSILKTQKRFSEIGI